MPNIDTRRCSSDRGEHHHRVGQRVLAEQAAVGHVHRQPEQPRRQEPDLARMVDAPVEQRERDEIGPQLPAASRSAAAG